LGQTSFLSLSIIRLTVFRNRSRTSSSRRGQKKILHESSLFELDTTTGLTDRSGAFERSPTPTVFTTRLVHYL
jgi:hypothetical protein